MVRLRSGLISFILLTMAGKTAVVIFAAVGHHSTIIPPDQIRIRCPVRAVAGKAHDTGCKSFGFVRVRITDRNVFPVNVALVFSFRWKERIRGMANPACGCSLVFCAAKLAVTCRTVLITALVYVMTLPVFVLGVSNPFNIRPKKTIPGAGSMVPHVPVTGGTRAACFFEMQLA